MIPSPDDDAIRANNQTGPSDASRREWIGLLARARPSVLENFLGNLSDLPAFEFPRRPESGLAIVRGRIGGAGAAFNLGEMTLTRCTVTTTDSATGARLDGIACIAGRDRDHAVLAAKLDALFQDSTRGAVVRDCILPKLITAKAEADHAAAARTAATKVEFFTMERGR